MILEQRGNIEMRAILSAANLPQRVIVACARDFGRPEEKTRRENNRHLKKNMRSWLLNRGIKTTQGEAHG